MTLEYIAVNNKSRGYLEYHSPFCKPFLCYNYNSYHREIKNHSNEVTMWKCMPDTCRQNLSGFIAVLTVMAVSTTIFNSLLIAISCGSNTRRILRRNQTMQNYSTYVISLSIADLLMGSIVLPLSILHFFLESFSPRNLSLNQKLLSSTNHSKMYFNETETFAKLMETSKDYNLKDRMQLDEFLKTFDLDYIDQRMVYNNLRETMELLVRCLGTLFHLALFVSLYTIAAASVDRYYVSTKAETNHFIRLSRSSYSKAGKSFQPKHCLIGNINRSSFVVLFIWIVGIFLALAPYNQYDQNRFHVIGHIFVVFSSTESHSIDLPWYITVLSVPLGLTWIFSCLLCITLWRRKNKLKQTTKTYSKQVNRRDCRQDDFREDILVVPSNVDTPPVTMEPPLVHKTGHSIAGSSKLSVTLNNANTESTEQTPCNYISFNDLSQAAINNWTLPQKRNGKTRRSRSFDSLYGLSKIYQTSAKKGVFINIKGHDGSDTIHYDNSSIRYVGVTSSQNGIEKKLLHRQSWSGGTNNSAHKLEATECFSPALSTPPSNHRSSLERNSSRFVTSPNNLNLPVSYKTDVPLSHSRSGARMRRKSSVFRAREAIRSKSFEKNISKTLFTVIATSTCAVLPLLAVCSQITIDPKESTAAKHNNDISALAITIAILISNSFWNCFIYGARMPYFRPAIIRIFRKVRRSVDINLFYVDCKYNS